MMKISMVNTDVLWSKPWCHGVMYMGCHDDHPPRTRESIRNPTFDHDINHTNGILNGLV